MPYVKRDEAGLIVGTFASPQPGIAEEFIENAELDAHPLTTEDYAAAVQAMLDAEARALGYDSIATAVTYADEPAVAKFQADGQALRARRSIAWAYAYATLADVEAGNISQPTVDEFVAGVPA